MDLGHSPWVLQLVVRNDGSRSVGHEELRAPLTDEIGRPSVNRTACGLGHDQVLPVACDARKVALFDVEDELRDVEEPRVAELSAEGGFDPIPDGVADVVP